MVSYLSNRVWSRLFFAIYNIEGKAAADKHIDSWTALLYSFGSATFFLFFFNALINLINRESALSNLLWLGNSATGWGILIFLGVAPTLGGFGLYTASLRHLSPTVANLIASTVTPELSLPSRCQVKEIDLVVNARVACDPDQLTRLVKDAVEQACAAFGATATFGSTQAFRPGRPMPTHRMATAK